MTARERARRKAAAGSRRTRQAIGVLRDDGLRALAARSLTAAATRLADDAQPLPFRPDAVRAADPRRPRRHPVPDVGPDGTLDVNWIMTPPAPNSGGHTTAMRLVEHLEARGHRCRIYLDDVYGRRAVDHEPGVRASFPGIRGPVRDVTDGMTDAHAVVATAWTTAYCAYADPCAGRRLYLVQDFEPWFHPRGGLAMLAENTYRLGFHGFTAGRFLADLVADRYGMTADWFEFGCDTDRYRLLDAPQRDGVVFYARPGAARRAFEVGMIALELFAERHPHYTIHLYGDPSARRRGRRFANCVDHGRVDPDALNRIYNHCAAGLSLSATNVSLVPHEMLAAGCIPVVNDAPHNRVVLDNDHVRYAPDDPHSLAQALADTASGWTATIAAAAAASVRRRSWSAAGEAFERVLRSELAGSVRAQRTAVGDVASGRMTRAGADPSPGTSEIAGVRASRGTPA